MLYDLRMIDVQRLRVFRAVVASGSVQAAAEHLGFTPSAVSQQISALQRETGLVLFEKAGRGIAPTASAKVLAAESEELMESLSRLGGVVDHLRDGGTGSLTIGAFSSAAQFWLPAVAKGLRRDFPDLVLDLMLNELGPEPPTMLRRDLDLTTEDADTDGVERPGHSRHVLAEEGYRVVAPRGHELLAEWDHQVPMLALAGQPLIDNDYHGNTCTMIIANACRAAGFTPRYVARSEDHHTALAFVAAGVGATILPALAVPESMAGVDSRELVSPSPRRRIVVHVRDAVACTPPVVRALELLGGAVDRTVARRAAR
jgi:DNA-binding transcriptional LysR family regulator